VNPVAAPDDDIIRASEIGQYTYCARAWWLRSVQGATPSNTAALARGRQAHDRHGRTVASAHRQRRLSLALTILALLLALAAILLVLSGGLP
jgi:CRISPR/Cas system-associated exonuclease Cas4 (RecB family)